MTEYYITWWNLENLFDIQDSPDRPEWLQKEIEGELEGWNQAVLERKIRQLASVITQLNDGVGPDLLGVCEVENKRVLDLLVESITSLGRNYAVAHHDASDKRGIDVAFIFDRDKFSAEEQFFHIVLKRTATRDLFQVNFRTFSGKLLIAIGNHWPSRRGETLRTEPYRIIAAETLSYWIQRILEIQGQNVAIVVMGDFNDEPFNRSIVEYALGTSSRMKVLKSKIPRLLNLSWPLLGQGLGTYYYSYFANVFDQFMISKGVVSGGSGFAVKQRDDWDGPMKLEIFDGMSDDGNYPFPIRFGRPSKKLNVDGFSDHYPISMILEEVA